MLTVFIILRPKQGPEVYIPEVAQIVVNPQPPTMEQLRQEFYVGLLAFRAPEGMDYMDIGSRLVLERFGYYNEALKGYSSAFQGRSAHSASWEENYFEGQEPLKFNFGKGEFKDVRFCDSSEDFDCTNKILQSSTYLQEVANLNTTYMQRYTELQQLPLINSFEYGVFDPMPYYSDIFNAQSLRLAQAVLAFEEGRADEGFELLKEELDFNKRVLAGDNSTLGHGMFQRLTQQTYFLISSLMDQPSFSPYLSDERLEALLAPLTLEEQQGLARAMANERDLHIRNIVTLHIENPKPFQEFFSSLFYDRYASANLTYWAYQPKVDRGMMSLEEVAELKVQGKLISLEEATSSILEKNKYWGGIFNYAGVELVGFSASMPVEKHFNHFYNLQTYIALLNAKHQILKADIKGERVLSFLGQVNAHNPYTLKPFEWDAETGLLSTDWLEEYAGSLDFSALGVGGERKELGRISVRVLTP